MRVLVAEDHHVLARTIATGLRRASIAVDLAASGDEAERMCLLTDYDVLVLDRALPVMTGDEVCRRLRDRRDPPRILILTAAGETTEKVYGLEELGADDYLAKPFDFAELVARIQVLYRRTPKPPTVVLWEDGIRMDRTRREVHVDGRPVDLTPKEFAVLHMLLASRGEPVSHRDLVRTVWDENLAPPHQCCPCHRQSAPDEARWVGHHRRRHRSRLPPHTMRRRHWSRVPFRTRLTLAFGGLFLLSGTALLAFVVVLARYGTSSKSTGIALSAKVRSDAEQTSPTSADPTWHPASVTPGEADGASFQSIDATIRTVQNTAMQQMLLWSTIGLVLMTVLVVLTGRWLAGRALRPVAAVTTTALRISETSLDKRLDLSGPDDELHHLADAFDSMLDRLQRAFDSQRRHRQRRRPRGQAGRGPGREGRRRNPGHGPDPGGDRKQRRLAAGQVTTAPPGMWECSAFAGARKTLTALRRRPPQMPKTPSATGWGSSSMVGATGIESNL